MDDYYIISDMDKRVNSEPHSKEWPKIIAISTVAQKILLAEGSGHGMMGCRIPIKDFKPDEWESLFKLTNSDWALLMLKSLKGKLEPSVLESQLVQYRKIVVKRF